MARGFLLGAAVAVGAVMLVPGAGPALARAGRPIARAAMRTGTTAYTEFRRAAAEAYEHFEDLAAEVRFEMQREQAAQGAAERNPNPHDTAAPTGAATGAEQGTSDDHGDDSDAANADGVDPMSEDDRGGTAHRDEGEAPRPRYAADSTP